MTLITIFIQFFFLEHYKGKSIMRSQFSLSIITDLIILFILPFLREIEKERERECLRYFTFALLKEEEFYFYFIYIFFSGIIIAGIENFDKKFIF
jgi:hypothetical protein